MNKPLTVEQLKALEVGDWVWIIVLKDDSCNNKADKGTYYPIRRTLPSAVDKELWCGRKLFGVVYEAVFDYAEYGDKWIAYKNKEQAEEKAVKAIFQPKYDENETVYIIDRVNEKYWSVQDGRCVVRKCFVVSVTKYAGYHYRIQPDDLPQEILDDSTLHDEYWERTFYEENRASSAFDTLYPTKEQAEARLKELQEKQDNE